MNGHQIVDSLIRGLTRPELARLERALHELLAAGQQEGDLESLIAEIKLAPAPSRALPPLPAWAAPESSAPFDSVEWRAEVSTGRLFELCVIMRGADDAAREAQIEREWSEVYRLVEGGLSYRDAWARIRARYGDWDTGFNPLPPASDEPGATEDEPAVARPARVGFRKRRDRLE